MEKRKNNRGSITLEAAIVVPLFIILMLLVNGLFVLFMGQQIMSHSLIQSAKSLAFDPYSSQRVSSDESDDLADMFTEIFSFVGGDYTSSEEWYKESNIEEIVQERYVAYLRENRSDTDALLEEIGVKNGVDGLDFSDSTLEDGVLTIKLKYTQEYIFNAAGLAEFDREISVKIKLFEYVRT